MGPQNLPVDPELRFWPKVDRSGDCWVWLASRNWGGYGQFWFDGRLVPAHRAAYILFVGPIPAGMALDHLCRNRACVRPSHLEPVTQRENNLRGNSPFAIHARKTHCPQGHEYTTANTQITAKGTRKCRECNRIRAVANYAKTAIKTEEE